MQTIFFSIFFCILQTRILTQSRLLLCRRSRNIKRSIQLSLIESFAEIIVHTVILYTRMWHALIKCTHSWIVYFMRCAGEFWPSDGEMWDERWESMMISRTAIYNIIMHVSVDWRMKTKKKINVVQNLRATALRMRVCSRGYGCVNWWLLYNFIIHLCLTVDVPCRVHVSSSSSLTHWFIM